jgi:hypothetical protein
MRAEESGTLAGARHHYSPLTYRACGVPLPSLRCASSVCPNPPLDLSRDTSVFELNVSDSVFLFKRV